MIDINELKLLILTPQMLSYNQNTLICDRVYKHWYKTWSEIFESKGLEEFPKKIQFMRQNFISVITYKDDVAGYMFNTCYNLKSFVCRDSPVFESISETTFQKFKKNNLYSAISIEYLTLMEEYRKGKIHIPISQILMGICGRLALELNIDAVFGTARRDYKVDAMTSFFGADAYQKDFYQYNLPCSLMVASMKTEKPHSNKFVEKIISTLWDQRVSCIPPAHNSTASEKHLQGVK